MLETLFLVVIGMFIGWNLPQPGYAKAIQTWIVTAFRNLTSKSE